MYRSTLIPVLAAVLALLVTVTAVATPAAATTTSARHSQTGTVFTETGAETPTIVAAYPNPVANEDAGEFVVIALPTGIDPGSYALTDGETTVSLRNATGDGRVAVANDPRASNVTTHPVVVAPSLSLSNAGERLRVRRDDTVVDDRRYRDAPEGQVATWNGSRIRWNPLGATDRPVVRGRAGPVQAFVLPDSPGVPVETLRRADRRVLLAGYTLTSERVVNHLLRAKHRNVTVRVLLEGEPVGGRTRREARLLDRLVAAGVDVRLVGGPRARYRYHHAKYAVVDERAIVLTENWKPAGIGGNSSRGWGVVTRQPRVVDALARTFRADADWRDARPWREFRAGRQFQRGERAVGGYPPRFESRRVPVEQTDVLVTPDNAQGELIRTLDGATESVDLVQVTLGDWDAPLVRAVRRAARRGVEVRILLSSAWYAREDNRKLVRRFDEWASARDAPLTAKLAEPGGRYGKIHAKGAVVDGDRVVLGSLNWNEQAATSNREVVLVLHGRRIADYFGGVFDRDWRGRSPRLPVGVLGAVAGCLMIAGLAARRLEFER